MPLRAAAEDDAPALADLLRRSPQAGRLLVAQDRRRDVFARHRAYERSVTLLDDRGAGGLVATVSVAVKTVLVAGRAHTAAYVFDLAVDADARRRGHARQLLHAAEQWAREQGAAFCYAHLMPGNVASLAAFVAAGYRVAVEPVLRLFPTFRTRPPAVGARPLRADDAWEDAARLVSASRVSLDLAVTVDGPALQARWTGLPGQRPEDVWASGSAVLGLWDHSAVSRSVPLALPPETRTLARLAAAAGRLGVAFPRLPALGEPLHLAYLLGGAGPPRTVRQLFHGALGAAHRRGFDFLMAVHDPRARPRWLRGALHVTSTFALMVKPLTAGTSNSLGSRAVWVDPADL